MKKIILILFVLVFTLSACSNEERKYGDYYGFDGTVVDIDFGKDDAMLVLENEHNENMTILISDFILTKKINFDIQNLKIGDKISVSGEAYNLGENKYLNAKIVRLDMSEEEECKRMNGVYERFGKSQFYICNEKTIDFGKKCNDNEQCDGYCLSENKSCSKFKQYSGCFGMMEKGKEVKICID